MNARALATQFGLTHQVLMRNVQGISHEQSVRLPDVGGNCLNWVAGHILVARDDLLSLLGATPLWDAPGKAGYVRGAASWTSAGGAEPFDEILRLLDQSHERLDPTLRELSDAALAAPLPPERNPFHVDAFGEALAVCAFHEAYHVGQSGLLRRWLGHPRVIG